MRLRPFTGRERSIQNPVLRDAGRAVRNTAAPFSAIPEDEGTVPPPVDLGRLADQMEATSALNLADLFMESAAKQPLENEPEVIDISEVAADASTVFEAPAASAWHESLVAETDAPLPEQPSHEETVTGSEYTIVPIEEFSHEPGADFTPPVTELDEIAAPQFDAMVELPPHASTDLGESVMAGADDAEARPEASLSEVIAAPLADPTYGESIAHLEVEPPVAVNDGFAQNAAKGDSSLLAQLFGDMTTPDRAEIAGADADLTLQSWFESALPVSPELDTSAVAGTDDAEGRPEASLSEVIATPLADPTLGEPIADSEDEPPVAVNGGFTLDAANGDNSPLAQLFGDLATPERAEAASDAADNTLQSWFESAAPVAPAAEVVVAEESTSPVVPAAGAADIELATSVAPAPGIADIDAAFSVAPTAAEGGFEQPMLEVAAAEGVVDDALATASELAHVAAAPAAGTMQVVSMLETLADQVRSGEITVAVPTGAATESVLATLLATMLSRR